MGYGFYFKRNYLFNISTPEENEMKNKPETFKTQREAYWYLQGFNNAQEQINELMDNRKKMYNIDLSDHLPTGDD